VLNSSDLEKHIRDAYNVAGEVTKARRVVPIERPRREVYRYRGKTIVLTVRPLDAAITEPESGLLRDFAPMTTNNRRVAISDNVFGYRD
jgi:hypothetical protein